jgi:hypothetical protein
MSSPGEPTNGSHGPGSSIGSTERLGDGDVERIAQRTVELLLEHLGATDSPTRIVDAAYIARRFGVERKWVYQHKNDLGALPMGKGRRPRLRFDLRRVEAAFEEMRTATHPPRRRGRPKKQSSGSAPLGLGPTAG